SETRIRGAQPVMRQGGRIDLGWRAAVQQQIGAGQQRLQHLRAFRHAPLVRVQPGEHPALAAFDHRLHAAQRIAAERFQLDDVAAEIGEQLAAIIQRNTRSDLQHAVRRQGHDGCSYGRIVKKDWPGVRSGAAMLANSHSNGLVSRGSMISSIRNASADRNGERSRSSRSPISASFVAGSGAASISARYAASTPPSNGSDPQLPDGHAYRFGVWV